MKCSTCIFLEIDLSNRDESKRIKYRYRNSCFCRCKYIGKPLNLFTEDDRKECHYIEGKRNGLSK